MKSGCTRHEDGRNSACANVAEVEDLQSRIAAHEEHTVAEGDAAAGLARGHLIHEVFSRNLQVAEIGDVERADGLAAQNELLRAGAERAGRRERERRRRQIVADQRQRTISVKLIRRKKRRRAHRENDCEESKPGKDAHTSLPKPHPLTLGGSATSGAVALAQSDSSWR